MCEVEEDSDGMGRRRWRWKQRGWRLQWSGLAVAFFLPLICSLPPAHGHIPVATEEEMRIEPTPVMVLAGPSSRQVVGFLRLPLEGSGGGPGRGDVRAAEGEGPARAKREYSLEDFLMWMPSGDGPTEEWKHRPRDTSWMRGDVITTTVFLTTTVYTTIFQPPLTPATLTPSSVTSTHILHTKSPSVNPNRILDKGGGKELGEGSVTLSNNVDANQNCSNHTNPLDRPQSDYPQSENNGNQIPDTSRDKDKSTTTQHRSDRTNYITVTRTITTPPPTLHITNPPILTTTTSVTQAEYDITDLVQPSVEYPGPSATITTSSATPSLSSTLPPGSVVATMPSMGETVINTLPSSSNTYGLGVPTTTIDGGGGDPSEGNIEGAQDTSHMLKPTGTTTPSESTEISSSNEHLTQEPVTSPMMTSSGNDATPSGAGGTTERPVGVTLTDVGVGAPGSEATTGEEAKFPDGTTEGSPNPQQDDKTLTAQHNPGKITTTEATVDNTVDKDTETNIRDPVSEGPTESSGNDPGNEAKTEPGHNVAVSEGTTDSSTVVPFGGATETNLGVPVEEATTQSSLGVKGATETSVGVPASEEPTAVVLGVPTDGTRNATDVHLNVNRTGGPEPTDTPGWDYTMGVGTTTPGLPPPTDSAHPPTDTLGPHLERNSTVGHEIELFDVTTPASQLTTPSSDLKTLVSDQTTPAFDLKTPAFGLTTPSSDLRTPASGLTTPESDLTTPESDLTTPESDLTTPASDLRTPESILTPVSNITPAYDITSHVSDLTTPVSDLTTPVSDLTTPVSDLTTPASELTTSDHESDTGKEAHDGNGTRNGTFGVDYPDPNGSGVVFFNVSEIGDGTQHPEEDVGGGDQDPTEDTDVYSSTPTVPDLGSSTSPPAVETELSPSLPEFGTTTGSVEAVDPSPAGLGNGDMDTINSTDSVTVWEDIVDETPTSDSPILVSLWNDGNNVSTSSYSSTEESTSREPFATDFPLGNSSGEYGVSSGFSPTSQPVSSLPTEIVNGSAILSPSKTVTPLSSSGIEASMSVVSLPVMPSQVTTPITVITSSVMPTVMDPSSYPPDNTYITMIASTGGPEVLDPSSHLPDNTYSMTIAPTGGQEGFDPSSFPQDNAYSTMIASTGGPEVLDPSSYLPENTYSTTTTPPGGPEVLTPSPYLPDNVYSTTTAPTGGPEVLTPSPYLPDNAYSTTTAPTGTLEVLDPSSYLPDDTYSTTTAPTEGPEVLDSSPYPPGNTYSTTSSTTGVSEVLVTPGTPSQDSSTGGYVSSIDSDDSGSMNLTETVVTDTVYESSVVPSSPEPPPTVETTRVSPTLESSQETSTEAPETSPTTYTTSLPPTEPDIFESLTTLDEEFTQTSYIVSETPSSAENNITVLTLTSIPSTSTTTTPVSVTLFSTRSQKPEITSTLSTTTLPVLHTSAESTTVSSSSTEESRLTSPVGTIPGTEQTTGPQPSPPSPSNNATVPLDQHYWVRTVIEGPPKESNSQLYWSKMEAALTQVYIMAYERNFARQQSTRRRELEFNKAPDRELNMAVIVTPISTTTTDPFENYTTIIARVRRDVMGPLNNEPTQPTRRLLAGYDTRILPARYETSPALLRNRVLIPLHAMDMESEKITRRGNKKLHVIKPWHHVRTRSRRKRWLERHTKQESSHDSKLLDEPRLLYRKSHVLRKRTVAKDVKVRLHNVTYDNNTDLTELVYTVFDGEEPILAREAVQNMSTVDDMEMAVVLDQVVVVKAEEYLQGPVEVRKSNLVYAVIGGVVGGVMLLVFLIWLSVFLCKRQKRLREELQPDSEAASPRSQLSSNAYTGHVNLAYSSSRDEKVDASPLPSTSHALEDHLEQASPASSHDSLISKPKQGPLLGSSNARSRRHLRQRQEEENERSQDDSPGEEEDGDTSEEEVTDGRRPKSGVPWRRPSQGLSRSTTEEPVYSSPNPVHIQYQPSHSTYSKYDTTHSELTSSDARYGPTHQLMANMLQSANSFTQKDQGSVFLPPPLLPPPQGFGKAHESPFIPGTSLPRFLPPPRLPKQMSPPKIPDHGTPSRIQAYDYDPEAPPIPPRNYTREEAGLPPLAHGLTSPTRTQMKDAQVETHMESDANGSSGSGEQQERPRRPSASSSHLSESGGSEGSMPHIGRLRRRFHDLLDDAFSLLNGQRPGDKVTPLTTPSPPRKGRSRSAAVHNKSYTHEVLEEEDTGGRPWSAAAIHTSPSAWRDNQVVGVVPLDEGRSPRSAWGDGAGRAGPGRIGSGHSGGRPGSGRPGSGRPGSGRPGSGRSARSITPVNLPPSSPDRPDGGRPSSGYAGVHARVDEPVDPDTGLRASDPAVPLIRAIKDELRRFKSTISTESSSA